MLHIRPRTFTCAVITSGLLSLTVAVADLAAAPATTIHAQATQSTPDAELVARIRQAIADDKAIAQYAQSLKIVASDGLVTLKGAVKTEADKKAIGAKADQIAGEKNVMNNVFVSADAARPAPTS